MEDNSLLWYPDVQLTQSSQVCLRRASDGEWPTEIIAGLHILFATQRVRPGVPGKQTLPESLHVSLTDQQQNLEIASSRNF